MSGSVVKVRRQGFRPDEPVIGRTIIAGADVAINSSPVSLRTHHASDNIESMSLLAGQSIGLIHEIRPEADILREMVSGTERLILQLQERAH